MAKSRQLHELGLLGYGVGFWRLVSWIVLAYLAFTMIYLASPASITRERADWFDPVKRLKLAALFSLRTAWKIGYGYDRARTRTYKAIARAPIDCFKVLFVCLLTVSHIFRRS